MRLSLRKQRNVATMISVYTGFALLPRKSIRNKKDRPAGHVGTNWWQQSNAVKWIKERAYLPKACRAGGGSGGPAPAVISKRMLSCGFESGGVAVLLASRGSVLEGTQWDRKGGNIKAIALGFDTFRRQFRPLGLRYSIRYFFGKAVMQ